MAVEEKILVLKHQNLGGNTKTSHLSKTKPMGREWGRESRSAANV